MCDARTGSHAREARRVAGLHGAGALIGAQATERAVRERLPSASIVHFASHGFLHPQRGFDGSFGVIADVHQDIMHDGVSRLRAFVEAMNDAKPDFSIQLGDFCVPHERNAEFMAT